MTNLNNLLEKYKQIEGERFFQDVFEKEEYKVVKEVYDVVLDVGACAGEFSAYIYDLAKTIYALEPQIDHYQELEENIDEFGLDKIKPFRVALDNQNGTGKLNIGSRGSHSLGGEDEEVETRTLATFLKENEIDRVDLLKIDIEGWEKNVFESTDFKDVADKIDVIIGEHLGNVIELLKGFGFEVSTHGANYLFKR